MYFWGWIYDSPRKITFYVMYRMLLSDSGTFAHLHDQLCACVLLVFDT